MIQKTVGITENKTAKPAGTGILRLYVAEILIIVGCYRHPLTCGEISQILVNDGVTVKRHTLYKIIGELGTGNALKLQTIYKRQGPKRKPIPAFFITTEKIKRYGIVRK